MRERPLPPRSSHYHPQCGHWCFRYGCQKDGVLVEVKCGECRTKDFNAARAASIHAGTRD